MKFRLKITIFAVFAVIIGVVLIPTYFILQTYGVFQKEKVLSDYALAVDVNGRSYEAWPLINSFAAMDKEEENRQLYYRVDMNHIQYLCHIAYQEFDIKPSEDNPFLAGTINYQFTENEYVKTEKQYTNAKDYTTVLNFYNQDKEVIYTYPNTGKGDGQLVQSIIHQGMSRSSNGGSEAGCG